MLLRGGTFDLHLVDASRRCAQMLTRIIFAYKALGKQLKSEQLCRHILILDDL